MKSGYCAAVWNRRDHGASEMTNHQPHKRLVFTQRRCCFVYGSTGKESYIMSSFQKIKQFQQILFTTRQLKALLKKKHLELVNRKSIRIIQDHMFLWWPGKNCYSLVGKFWFILHIHQTLHLQISIYLSYYKIFLIEKISISLKTVKGTWNSSLLKMTKHFWKMELWSCLKYDRR